MIGNPFTQARAIKDSLTMSPSSQNQTSISFPLKNDCCTSFPLSFAPYMNCRQPLALLAFNSLPASFPSFRSAVNSSHNIWLSASSLLYSRAHAGIFSRKYTSIFFLAATSPRLLYAATPFDLSISISFLTAFTPLDKVVPVLLTNRSIPVPQHFHKYHPRMPSYPYYRYAEWFFCFPITIITN